MIPEERCTKHKYTESQRVALVRRWDEVHDEIIELTAQRKRLGEMMRLPVCRWRTQHVRLMALQDQTMRESFHHISLGIVQAREEHDGDCEYCGLDACGCRRAECCDGPEAACTCGEDGDTS